MSITTSREERQAAETTLKCSVCRRTFTGTPAYLRATIWPHAATHKRPASFSSTFVLSCNCGECDFCREQPCQGGLS